MTKHEKDCKGVHFGSISIPLAKQWYLNGNYSLTMVLLYIDSRKGKKEDGGYPYKFEYNAPDIHYNTGVGLKVINRHLRMLKLRGALSVITDGSGNPERTKKGAIRYKVVKDVYEREWGPNSRGVEMGQIQPLPDEGNILNEGQSEPSANQPNLQQAETSQPTSDPVNIQYEGVSEASLAAVAERTAGQSEPSLKTGLSEKGTESRAVKALQAGHSGPSLNTLTPGHSAPTNNNERIREEKYCAQKEESAASDSPPLSAPASSSALTKEGDSFAHTKSSPAPASLSRSRTKPVAAPDPNPHQIDPVYHMPVSYVARYKKHSAALNQHIQRQPEIGILLANASDSVAAHQIMGLLDELKLQ